MPAENELDEKKKKSQKTLEEQLAELLFDDKKKKKDIKFYTLYYNYDKPYFVCKAGERKKRNGS